MTTLKGRKQVLSRQTVNELRGKFVQTGMGLLDEANKGLLEVEDEMFYHDSLMKNYVNAKSNGRDLETAKSYADGAEEHLRKARSIADTLKMYGIRVNPKVYSSMKDAHEKGRGLIEYLGRFNKEVNVA